MCLSTAMLFLNPRIRLLSDVVIMNGSARRSRTQKRLNEMWERVVHISEFCPLDCESTYYLQSVANNKLLLYVALEGQVL